MKLLRFLSENVNTLIQTIVRIFLHFVEFTVSHIKYLYKKEQILVGVIICILRTNLAEKINYHFNQEPGDMGS